MSTAITVEHLSKEYRLGMIGGATLQDDLKRWWAKLRRKPDPLLTAGMEHHAQRRGEQFLALQDVSFAVAAGDVVGIIGRNGAGKSTLLKILSQVTSPTAGLITLRGRMASLLEVGTGFHPELTGRENIFLNGAILGMNRTEIRNRLDEIIAFAEIDEFVDTPVKRYSSGMYVRLAFAVAAHLEPEILVIDEVLAVGDAAFQRKCLGKMSAVATEGRTVLFVSHNMAAIQNLCRSAHLLAGGRLVASGDPIDVIAGYLQSSRALEDQPLAMRSDRQGNGKLRFAGFAVSGPAASNGTVMGGSAASFAIAYHGTPPLDHVQIDMSINSQSGDGVLYLSNQLIGKPIDRLEPNGRFEFSFAKLPLLPGTYNITLYCTVGGALADWVVDAACVDVIAGDYFGTGRVPPRGYGSIAVPFDLDVIPDRE
jgi:lipopolysaccharide transport system ATP-binding protein